MQAHSQNREVEKITVIELFAGVGGFRLGLEGWQGKSASSNYTEELGSVYQVIWSNQWEPSTKAQHASWIYSERWGDKGHTNIDINSVDVSLLPKADMVVGGFPCQDYSVASTSKNAKGLIGKKGVLWWAIYRILSEANRRPKYLLLENVDRLLISPSSQRGRDFAVMLQCLNNLGYAVEWRIINAADYGMPQRRKRVFILAYLEGTGLYQAMAQDRGRWLAEAGVLAEAFPAMSKDALPLDFRLERDIVKLSEDFNQKTYTGSFLDSGLMINGEVLTQKLQPIYNGMHTLLGDIVIAGEVPKEYLISDEEAKRWAYLKGAKKEVRINSEGYQYNYSEGAMAFPDSLDRPARTIITGEGGRSASRFKHVIQTKEGLRRLLPVELERLNMFPDNHTQLDKISDTKRAFFMGNALVVGIVEKIGQVLSRRIYGKEKL